MKRLKDNDEGYEYIAADEPSYLAKFWQGKGPLWLAYWVNFLLVGFGLSKIADVGFINDSALYLSIYLLFIVVYYIWASVSVWRCAFNVNQKFWGYIARTFVCMGHLVLIAQILTS